ncbi:SGNH/GDSL hydrolase family protein [Streptomyces sp. NBC_00344]|uniref:SGNH/GDSL hydrolase family protein n=1 Tax=Streptomyces sp. NBC_00344 TaxID=2975720 RepID=UPI002E1F95E9
MTIQLAAQATILFQGDSITDSDRVSDHEGLGNGYVRRCADALEAAHPGSGLTILNRGVSGNRVTDLRARWQEDTIALKPDLVSIMVGINDTWRRYDAGDPTPVEAYEKDYRHILSRVRDELGADIILIEPFLLPVSPEQWEWREDLDPRIMAVRRLAAEFDASLLAADGLLSQAVRAVGGAEQLTPDGVHPTPVGDEVIARAWTELVGLG